MAKVSLFDLEYVIFDFETTGLEPHRGDEILEIGAIKLKGTEPTGEVFETLIDVERDIPAISTSIHGIENKDIEGKPTIDEVFPKFLDFIGNKMLIAHNADFDLAFIKKNLARFPNLIMNNRCLDTLRLSKHIFSFEKRHNLDAIANRFGIRSASDRHRSVGDCMLTAKVFKEFLTTLKRKRAATLNDIRSCIVQPPRIEISQPQESLSLL